MTELTSESLRGHESIASQHRVQSPDAEDRAIILEFVQPPPHRASSGFTDW